jgi:replicative DNA helicase
VTKPKMHRVNMERFNTKKLNDIEGKGQYYVEVSNRFAALENIDAEVDIIRAWETIREIIKFSAQRDPRLL